MFEWQWSLEGQSDYQQQLEQHTHDSGLYPACYPTGGTPPNARAGIEHHVDHVLAWTNDVGGVGLDSEMESSKCWEDYGADLVKNVLVMNSGYWVTNQCAWAANLDAWNGTDMEVTGTYTQTVIEVELDGSMDPPAVYPNENGTVCVAGEHCLVKDHAGLAWSALDWYGLIMDYYQTNDYTRTAQKTIRLKTGGPAGSTRQNLWQLQVTAASVPNVRAVPPYYYEPQVAIPPQNITVNGKTVGSDGNIWLTLPDNTTNDVTACVKNQDFYTFTVTPQKVIPDVQLAADVIHSRQGINFGGDDLTSPSKPFRFWVNDDDDNGDIGNTDVPGSGHNGSSGHVNGRGDVIDFFPVALRIGDPNPNLPPPDGFEYRLAGSSSLYFVYVDPTRGLGAFDYLTDATGVSAYGHNMTDPPFAAGTEQVKADGTVLSQTFTNKLFHNGGGGTVLMEAASDVLDSPGIPGVLAWAADFHHQPILEHPRCGGHVSQHQSAQWLFRAAGSAVEFS